MDPKDYFDSTKDSDLLDLKRQQTRAIQSSKEEIEHQKRLLEIKDATADFKNSLADQRLHEVDLKAREERVTNKELYLDQKYDLEERRLILLTLQQDLQTREQMLEIKAQRMEVEMIEHRIHVKSLVQDAVQRSFELEHRLLNEKNERGKLQAELSEFKVALQIAQYAREVDKAEIAIREKAVEMQRFQLKGEYQLNLAQLESHRTKTQQENMQHREWVSGQTFEQKQLAFEANLNNEHASFQKRENDLSLKQLEYRQQTEADKLEVVASKIRNSLTQERESILKQLKQNQESEYSAKSQRLLQSIELRESNLNIDNKLSELKVERRFNDSTLKEIDAKKAYFTVQEDKNRLADERKQMNLRLQQSNLQLQKKESDVQRLLNENQDMAGKYNNMMHDKNQAEYVARVAERERNEAIRASKPNFPSTLRK